MGHRLRELSELEYLKAFASDCFVRLANTMNSPTRSTLGINRWVTVWPHAQLSPARNRQIGPKQGSGCANERLTFNLIDIFGRGVASEPQFRCESY